MKQKQESSTAFDQQVNFLKKISFFASSAEFVGKKAFGFEI